MISDALALIDFIKRTHAEWSVKIAHFDGSGQKINGDTDLLMQVHNTATVGIFYFQVTPITGYTFLRYPVNPGGVIEDLGSLTDGTFTSEYFRFIRAGRLSATGHLNVRVPFIIYGYKTETLLDMGSPIGP